MVASLLAREAVSMSEVVFIADRTYTDMEMANRLACDFVCVLSGETKREDIEELTDFPSLKVQDIGGPLSLIWEWPALTKRNRWRSSYLE
jgi:ribonucleotide monophosphatase NagD (HAD superfamily)